MSSGTSRSAALYFYKFPSGRMRKAVCPAPQEVRHFPAAGGTPVCAVKRRFRRGAADRMRRKPP